MKHQGIIDLWAVAESPKHLFLITELCEGDTLASQVDILPKDCGLEEHFASEIIRQVAGALSYLHNRGIIHRDLKASNIMLLHEVKLCYRQLVVEEEPDTQLQQKKESVSPQRVSIIQATQSKRTLAPAVQTSISEKSNHSRISKKSISGNRLSTRGRMSKIYGKSSKSEDPPRDPIPKELAQTIGQPNNPVTEKPKVKVQPKAPPSTLRTKLIDFGLAIEVRKNEETCGTLCGTPLYMAPEVINGRSYTRQCDVWSLGVLLFNLLTGRVPFLAHTEAQLLDQVNKIEIPKFVQSMNYISDLAKNCLTRVLNVDPAYRYSASELLLDPWITQFSPVNQDEVTDPIDTLKQYDSGTCSGCVGPVIDSPARGNTINLSSEATLSKSLTASQCRPLSVGYSQSIVPHTATNVLELMKQFHKELHDGKQPTPENVD